MGHQVLQGGVVPGIIIPAGDNALQCDHHNPVDDFVLISLPVFALEQDDIAVAQRREGDGLGVQVIARRETPSMEGPC